MADPKDLRGLPDFPALAFPLRVGADGPATSGRADHIRDQIAQVLFTTAGERVFRPEFGGGVKALVFEPNQSALRELATRRLQASLADALQGEVDPRSIEIEVAAGGARPEALEILVRYRLTALGTAQEQRFGPGGGHG